VVVLLLLFGSTYTSQDISIERDRIKGAIDNNQTSLQAVKASLTSNVWLREFGPTKSAAAAAWSQLNSVKHEYDTERRSLLLDERNSFIANYLSSFLLADADIPGIGKSRVATLVSFGIESAADIAPGRISSIQGFGDVLESKILTWRSSLMTRCQMPSDETLMRTHNQQLGRKYHLRRLSAASDFESAATLASSIKEKCLSQKTDLERSLKQLSAKDASLRADLALLS
jgi:DNA-binding helix-hairpin-helix protein with protein kinase domain